MSASGSGFQSQYRPRPMGDPASVFGKGIAPGYTPPTGGMDLRPPTAMPSYAGGEPNSGLHPRQPPTMPSYQGMGQLNNPMDKPMFLPPGLQGQTNLPQNNPFSNYASVAGFQMPGASQAQPKGISAPPTQNQQPYLIRPQQPPPPQGPAQQGQAGYQWGQANSINGDGDVGWQPAFGPAARAYIGQMTNTASGVQPWLPQVNWNDALNSIGQLSGTPFNPSMWGNL